MGAEPRRHPAPHPLCPPPRYPPGQGGALGQSLRCSWVPAAPSASCPPGQPGPPCCGAGQEQARCRVELSSPHVLEHGVHGDHSHQPPGTAG